MSVAELNSVARYRALIEPFLQRLAELKQNTSTEHPLSEAECADLLEQLAVEEGQGRDAQESHNQYAAIETVFRELFYDLLASNEISDPTFSQVWTLLDVAATLSDAGICEPGLVLWLVEELLDSQTIDGCRKIFTYLESRRERLIAKNFKQKQLIFLRFCNELLRRLSRAEDTVLCGRVFIFLFQSFPLGDKSSVNLRGQFHVENVTTFDAIPDRSQDAPKPMEIESEIVSSAPSGAQTPASSAPDHESSQKASKAPSTTSKSIKAEDEPPNLDDLYPIFWSLQSFFSLPTRLFEANHMTAFKSGISSTLSYFQTMSNASASTTPASTAISRGLKRKRSSTDSDSSSVSSSFNPKYLTNRDLFELELHDPSFRRHILVQTLITLDFLLSLAPAAKSKQKLETLTNKSVLYAHTLSADDTTWCANTKSAVATYLQGQGNGNEGKFYYRMVDTVLSRDKNWVRWKAENCPSISRTPITPAMYVEAQATLTKICADANRPLPVPPGVQELEFLNPKNQISMEGLKERKINVPSMEQYYKAIQEDELDAEIGTEEEKAEALESMHGKVWRALRASGRRFVLSEKMHNGRNLKALVGEDEGEEKNGHGEGGGGDEAGMAADQGATDRDIGEKDHAEDTENIKPAVVEDGVVTPAEGEMDVVVET